MTLKVKLCFLVETTFKMTNYLQDVQSGIDNIINQIRFYNPGASVLVSSICYRDHKDCEALTYMGFMTPEEYWSFPMDIVSESRVAWFSEVDTADVAGAIDAVKSFNWSDADVRAIYHFGISPAHGVQFHGPEVSDQFPKGDPDGNDPLRDMHEFSVRGFDYTFFRITPAVDTMLEQFDTSYTGPGKFDVQALDTFTTYISEPDSEAE